jgi:hypothetical protein
MVKVGPLPISDSVEREIFLLIQKMLSKKCLANQKKSFQFPDHSSSPFQFPDKM